MPESNITGITAPIYSADLLYEQNCKCGALSATNISGANCMRLTEGRYLNGQEILGNFTAVTAGDGEHLLIILYKDCTNS